MYKIKANTKSKAKAKGRFIYCKSPFLVSITSHKKYVLMVHQNGSYREFIFFNFRIMPPIYVLQVLLPFFYYWRIKMQCKKGEGQVCVPLNTPNSSYLAQKLFFLDRYYFHHCVCVCVCVLSMFVSVCVAQLSLKVLNLI